MRVLAQSNLCSRSCFLISSNKLPRFKTLNPARSCFVKLSTKEEEILTRTRSHKSIGYLNCSIPKFNLKFMIPFLNLVVAVLPNLSLQFLLESPSKAFGLIHNAGQFLRPYCKNRAPH